MKDQWAAGHVLDADTQWKDTVKQHRRAAAKDTTKLSSSAPKTDAATAEQTPKYPQGTTQYSKEKQKSSRSKQKNADPDYKPYENFWDQTQILKDPTKRSKGHL